MAEAAAAIHLRDVTFSYGSGRASGPTDVPVLDIPDLRINAGERVFLHGPSGSGKTTLLGLIAGVILPRRGSVEVLGRDLTQLSASARDQLRGSEIGYIFQSFNLIPYLSVRDNIALPCQVHAARRARIKAASLDSEIDRIARHLDIAAHLDRPVDRLSTGQQQRVAIARAVLGRPRLVIADEPTSALDTDRRELFLSLLLDITGDAGATLLFVSHDHSLAHRFERSLSLGSINRAAGRLSAADPETSGARA